MSQLVIYTILFVAVLVHCFAAAKMYREVNADTGLSFREKNDWKLKSLISPALYWKSYRQDKKRRIS
jgi:hypothetical protein